MIPLLYEFSSSLIHSMQKEEELCVRKKWIITDKTDKQDVNFVKNVIDRRINCLL